MADCRKRQIKLRMINVKKIFYNFVSFLSSFIIGVFFLIVGYICLKVFVYDTFPVNSYSMMPSIQPGDRVFVNKLLFGSRIYKNLNFLEGGELNSFRIKGFRGIKYNDVLLFNHLVGEDWSRTGFVINGVYAKRCIGLPGDTLSIINGAYKNSSVSDKVLHTHFPDPKGKRTIEPSILICYPYDDRVNWTILDFGPLYIPRKGDSINLTIYNAIIYRKYIEYETGKKMKITDDSVFLKEIPVNFHVFKNNYFFMAGDNFPDSRDSRYFGLIPEEFIIGIAPIIIFSRDPITKRTNYHRITKPI